MSLKAEDANVKESGSCEHCRQPTIQKCSSCKQVFYCNLEHEKANWDQHKGQCRTFKVCIDKNLGRFLITTRDLEGGEEIFSELPLVVAPKPQGALDGVHLCVGCCRVLFDENCEFCPGCSWPCCSTKCEGLKDASLHGLECGIFRNSKVKNLFRYDISVIIRSLYLKCNEERWKQFVRFENHLDKRSAGCEIYASVEEKIRYLRENFLNDGKAKEFFPFDVTNDLIHLICATVDVNGIDLPFGDARGVALYPTAGFIEHNCSPNIVQIVDAKNHYKVAVIAARPFKKFAHLHTSYADLLQGTQIRRGFLKKARFFNCCCDRCKDPEEFGTFFSALKCLGTDVANPCGGIQLPAKPAEEKIRWFCNSCKIKLPNREIAKFVDHLGNEVDKILNKHATLGELKDTWSKLLNFLHPNHFHIFKLKMALLEHYKPADDLQSEQLEERITICQELLDVIKKLDPHSCQLDFEHGLLLHTLFESKFILISRLQTTDKNAILENEIKDVLKLIEENKVVLRNSLKNARKQELLQNVHNTEKKFRDFFQINLLN